MTRPPLIDGHGRVHDYLRISVTDRCNLRCGYCMPSEGIAWKPREDLLSYEEILRVARLFVEMGVTTIRLTGGEPLVRGHLDRLIGALALLPGLRRLALTTNGVLLHGQAQRIRAAGITHLNLSLDTLQPDRFEAITRRPDFWRVREVLDEALGAGFRRVKLNVVVMGGVNDDELLDFVALTERNSFGLRFIEYMPFAGNGWTAAALVPYAEQRRRIATRYALLPCPAEPSAVAREFAISGHRGTVGFITSMTDDFCSTCSRVRLTADGAFKACLHDPAESDLRSALRGGESDDAVCRRIRASLWAKPEKHESAETLVQIGIRSMIQIGG